MTSKRLDRLIDSEGKGLVGCISSIVLFGVAIFLGIKLVPIYYSNFNFESDLKSEVSRVGARFIDNETVVKDVLELAKRNDIRLKKENVRVERFAGQVHINVHYTVPVDFVILEHDLKFQITVSSFTAAG